ncbi:MAG: EAL domain-containing protein [Rhodoferax sp.]
MSLRARLLALVLLATLLPALLLGWRFFQERDAEMAAAIRALASAADNLGADLEHRVQGTAQLHFGLAYAGLLDNSDRGACSAYLSRVREAYPQYTGIITVRPDGRLHCDSLQSGRDLQLADRAYFRQATAGTTGLLLESAFGRLTGNSVLQVVYPARDDVGALRFLLVASLNLQKFAQEAHPPSMMNVLPEVLLLDSKGTVMAWSGAAAKPAPAGTSLADDPLFAFAQAHAQGGVGEVRSSRSGADIWAVASSATARKAGLHLMLGLPREALAAQSEQRLRQGLLVVGAAALLLFAGVWSLAEWGVRRQVARITRMVHDLGAGQLDSRIALPHPRGELGGLMGVLNATAESLQQQRAEIQDLGDSLRRAHLREIAERAQNEQRLAHMANFDTLTGLPNRAMFHDRLRLAIARARRSGRTFALMFMDLDHFKNVNDNLGHRVGDQLLVAVARAIGECLRDTDTIGLAAGPLGIEGVFRLGGDEFTILSEELNGPEDAHAIARRILDRLRQPFLVENHELFASASIGITVFNQHQATDPESLIQQADMAMYRAKDSGRDTYAFFDADMHREASRRHQLEGRMRHALERGEFRLFYQPKARLSDGEVTGVEALLRWQPEGEALVPPNEFIPVLEETGLIVPVGAWALQEACAQMVRWEQSGGLRQPLRLAVNLSARQFRHQDLVEQVSTALAQSGFDPRRLELELTESMLIDDSEAVVALVARLQAMRVRIAIDDFGTGHSSLSYLKRFNVDTLKIDRSFVLGTPHDSENCAIATAVVALGHGLRLNVVAEGVETLAQADFLRGLGCDELQGYLLSPPLDDARFAAWLQADRPRATTTIED